MRPVNVLHAWRVGPCYNGAGSMSLLLNAANPPPTNQQVSRVEMQEDEDRVYHVFVAPGPSYVSAVHASPEIPFVGVAFSYIVPGSGGAPVPSIAAHDVGGVDDAAGAGEERVYVIVLNAVDAIRAVEVGCAVRALCVLFRSFLLIVQ